MTVDTTHTVLIVNVRRSVVKSITIVVLVEDILVRVTTIEGVVVDRWVKEATVVCGVGEVDWIFRILEPVREVLILIETDTPELEYGTVRSLVTSDTRVVSDTAYDDAIADLAHVTDNVVRDVSALAIIDLIWVSRLKFIGVRVGRAASSVHAVLHVT